MIYPVLEHTFKVSRTTGYVFIPYAPSSANIITKESGKIDISHFGTTIPFDTTTTKASTRQRGRAQLEAVLYRRV